MDAPKAEASVVDPLFESMTPVGTDAYENLRKGSEKRAEYRAKFRAKVGKEANDLCTSGEKEWAKILARKYWAPPPAVDSWTMRNAPRCEKDARAVLMKKWSNKLEVVRRARADYVGGKFAPLEVPGLRRMGLDRGPSSSSYNARRMTSAMQHPVPLQTIDSALYKW